LEFSILDFATNPLLQCSVTPAYLCLLLAASCQPYPTPCTDNYSLKGFRNRHSITNDAFTDGATSLDDYLIPDNAFLNYYVTIHLTLSTNTNHAMKLGMGPYTG